MRLFFHQLLIACLAAAVAMTSVTVRAQRIQIPPPSMPGGATGMVPVQPLGQPWNVMPPAGGPGVGAPGAVLGTPTFDPYAAGAGRSVFGAPVASPYGAAPQPWYGSVFGQPAPVTQAPPVLPPQGGYPSAYPSAYGAPSPYGAPAYPSYPGGYTPNPYPGQTPSSLYPNGIDMWNPNSFQFGDVEPLRLFQNLRLRYTWLEGEEGRDLDINDIEVATTMQFPTFLGTTQPLLISPNFAMHLWDGPQPPATSHLPAQAYSAYLEAAYRSDPSYTFGADISVSAGVYSDFNAITTQSLRFQGLGYGWVRLTPTFMFKAGVQYLDRVDLALLPAIGFYWEPNPQTRLDIFFPKPKLSRYLTTLGTTDLWGYVAAEYGGGSWTIERIDGTSDQIDINDIRLIVGFEWTAQNGWRGMFEAGWVTNRDLVYRFHPADNLSLRDTYMLRAGLTW